MGNRAEIGITELFLNGGDLLQKIELQFVVVGLGDHDLEHGERPTADVEASEYFGSDIDGCVFDLDNRKLITLDAILVGFDPLLLSGWKRAEILKVTLQQAAQQDEIAAVFGLFLDLHEFLIFGTHELDIHFAVVADFVVELHMKGLEGDEQARHALLAVEDVGERLAFARCGQLNASDIANRAQPLHRAPEDEGADGVAFDDAVDQSRTLLPRPDEGTLKLGDLHRAIFDLADERGKGDGLGFRKMH